MNYKFFPSTPHFYADIESYTSNEKKIGEKKIQW